jgi:hypothetical protein
MRLITIIASLALVGGCGSSPTGPAGSAKNGPGGANNGGETLIRVVSDSELTVRIPASLLARAGMAHLVVENGDPMAVSDGYDRYPKSNAVDLRSPRRPIPSLSTLPR